jgi:hypothetical protein
MVRIAVSAALSAGVLLASSAQARIVLVKEAHFKVEVPDKWEVGRRELGKDGKTWVIHLASEGRKLRLRIRATPSPGAVNLRQALTQWLKDHLAQWAKRSARLSVAEQDVDGRRSLLAHYMVEMPRMKTLQKYRALIMLVQAKRGWLYTITGFIQDSVYQVREAELGTVISSFHLLGTAAVEEKEDDRALPEGKFSGKTQTIADRAGRWQLQVPQGWTVRSYGKSTGGGARSSRIVSPSGNVRIFVRVREEKAERYDYDAHFQRFVKRMAERKYFEHLDEIRGARGGVDEQGRTAQWRTYKGIGRRLTTLQPYRVLAAALHSKRLGRVYTLTMSVHRNHYERHLPELLAILESFGPTEAGGK